MIRSRAALAVSLAAAFAVLPGRAGAQTSAHDRAQALLAQGVSQFDARDYTAAAATFRQAYDTFPSHKILFNLGEAELKLGHAVEAANALDGFLQLTQAAPDIAAQRATAAGQLTQVRPGLALLQLSVAPATATVTVDGVAPFTHDVYVAAGAHQLRVSAEGFVTESRSVTVAPDDRRKVVLTLAPVPPPAVASAAPPTPAPKPVVEPALQLAQPAPTARRAVGGVLLGVGAAAGAASVVFGALAAGSSSHLRSEVLGRESDLSPAEVQGLRGSVRTDAWVSTATLGAGVVCAAVGAVLLLTGRSPKALPTAANGRPALSFNF